MGKRLFLFVASLILVGSVAWFFSKGTPVPQSPCDDPEYLALKQALANASPAEREALLRAKGPMLQRLEEERAKCLQGISKYTPPSDDQRATAIAIHKTQIAQEEKRAAPTPLVSKGYEGPVPTIAIPTVHSDEFLPFPISWRLFWQGKLTIIQVGLIGESGISRGKSGLLLWRPQSRGHAIEIVPLVDKPLGVSRLDIVTVCKPFVVIAGKLPQNKTKIWVYDLADKSARSVLRSRVPCWDANYEKRDPAR